MLKFHFVLPGSSSVHSWYQALCSWHSQSMLSDWLQPLSCLNQFWSAWIRPSALINPVLVFMAFTAHAFWTEFGPCRAWIAPLLLPELSLVRSWSEGLCPWRWTTHDFGLSAAFVADLFLRTKFEFADETCQCDMSGCTCDCAHIASPFIFAISACTRCKCLQSLNIISPFVVAAHCDFSRKLSNSMLAFQPRVCSFPRQKYVLSLLIAAQW